MHENSRTIMKKFIETFLDPLNPDYPLRILDVGSYDVNGTYKDLFQRPNWTYVGADIEAGPNVDIVFKSPYDWGDEQYDVVISGQCCEHVPDLKAWGLQLKKTLRKGGICCVIAPFYIHEHRFPVDCWRLLPDGMRFILEGVCEFQVLACYLSKHDCLGIAKRWKE